MSRLDKIKTLIENREFKVYGVSIKANYGVTIVLRENSKEEVIYVPFSDNEWVKIFLFTTEKIGVPRD